MPDLASLFRELATRLDRADSDSDRLLRIESLLLVIGGRLATLEGKIDAMSTTQQQMDTGLAQITTDVSDMRTVVGGARAAFDGLAAKLAAAISASQAAGATPQQLTSIQQIHSDLVSEREALANAVAAGTAAANEPDANAGQTTTGGDTGTTTGTDTGNTGTTTTGDTTGGGAGGTTTDPNAPIAGPASIERQPPAGER